MFVYHYNFWANKAEACKIQKTCLNITDADYSD